MGLGDIGSSEDGKKWQLNCILEVELTALGKGLYVRVGKWKVKKGSLVSGVGSR